MSAKQTISLMPVAMTPEVMQELEDKNLILRITPGIHDLETPEGSTFCKTLYDPLDGFGPHKIMCVTVNRTEFAEFGIHPDNEDFFLIGGGAGTKPLYLVIGLCLQPELEAKISNGTVSPADFIALEVKYNDPEVSFFTMLKNVPHGEAVGPGPGKAPSFYVAESRDMADVDTVMGNYRLAVL